MLNFGLKKIVVCFEHWFFLLLAGSFYFTPGLSWAGAWTRADGEVYSKWALSQIDSSRIYAAKGNKKIDGPDFEERAISLYGEYGFDSHWTGIANLSWKFLETKSSQTHQSESGLADIWLYAKRSLRRDPLVLSAQLGVKLPLGYNENDIPPLGQGQIDWEGRLLVAKSFHPAYINSEIGYRFRNGVYSDEVPYRLEAGSWLNKAMLIRVALDGVSNRSNDDASKAPNRAPNIFDQEYMKVGPGLIFLLKKEFAVELSYDNVVAGANTAASQTFSMGLSWQGVPSFKNR